MGENIIMIIVLAWTAFVMIVVGVFQIKCIEPVGFYTGDNAPKREQVSDVAVWNKKHGMMWIAYGVGIVFAYFIGLLIGDEKLSYILFMGVMFGSIPVMMAYHHLLKKKYVK